MPPDDPRIEPQTSDVPYPTPNVSTACVPLADGATSEAESLFRVLQGVARPTPMPPLSGLPRIPGYEIECELGHGGMGVVYKARDTELKRDVAIKMILTSGVPSTGEVARFRAEAESVAAVRHPNVIQVYELCPPDCPRPYFTMEYIKGGSLANRLKQAKQGDKLAPAAAAELIAAVADGLQAAHDADIVHRDIKPANILLGKAEPETNDSSKPTSSFQPKVSDFGLAKRLAFDLTRTQDMKGTPAYMSPEQASGGTYVGPGADVYALGVVLFECLTGRPPFNDEDQFALIQDVISTPAPSLRSIEATVPRDLELICLKCLEKKPQHRYPTAAALAADLRAFAAGRSVSVRPIGPLVRVVRWGKRRPAAAGLIALLLLALFVLPPVAAWGIGQVNTSAAREAEAAAAARAADAAAREAEALATAAAAREAEAAARESIASKLAATQKLHALLNALRARAANRPLSWTVQNRADLLQAVVLAAGDPQAMRELRTAGAAALLTPDLEPLDAVQKGFSASAIATDPKSGLVALGEYLTWAPLTARVRLIDPATGRVVRELGFTAGIVRDTATTNYRAAPDTVRSLAFSPDGTKLFVGTRSSQVIRFDLDRPGNGEALRWKASIAAVEQLAVSPDGSTVYGLCRPEKPVFAWAATTGKLLAKLAPSGEAPITAFAVLGTGELVTCDAHELRRWTSGHKPVLTVPNDGVGRLAATPSGMLLAGDRRHLDVYDPTELVRLDRFATAELRVGVHEEFVRTIAVHPSGAFVASCSGDADRTLRVWELASCRLVGTVLVKGTGPIAVGWSADGSTLLATGNGHTARWSFRAAAAQQFACLSAAPLATVAFGPKGQVAALTDVTGGQRELLLGTANTPAGSVRFTSRGGNGRPGLAFAPGGWLAITAPAPGVIRWEPGTPVPAPGFVSELAWCPRFGTPDGDAARPLWAVVDSSDVYSFGADNKTRTTWSNWVEGKTLGLASIDALAVGRDVVVAGGRSGTVHVLGADKGQVLFTAPDVGDPVLSVAIGPDDGLIVAGTQGGKVRVIRTSDQKELPALSAHPDAVTTVSVNHDGTLLATGGRDRTVKLWKRTGERFELLFAVPDLSGPVHEVQFNPADDRLLVLIAQERAARVWDIERLKGQLGRCLLAW